MRAIIKVESEETIKHIMALSEGSSAFLLSSMTKPGHIDERFTLFIYSKQQKGIVFECTCDAIYDYCQSQTRIYSYRASSVKNTEFLWHISDIKVYDEPRDLHDFSRFGCILHGGACINGSCSNFINNGYYEPPQCAIDGCTITRPPFEWCYTEVGA